MIQRTIDEEIERTQQIERLDRSLARWREIGLDQRLPDEYRHFCAILAHLRDGGPYTIRRFDPAVALNTSKTAQEQTLVGAMVRDIAGGFAAASRRKWR